MRSFAVIAGFAAAANAYAYGYEGHNTTSTAYEASSTPAYDSYKPSSAEGYKPSSAEGYKPSSAAYVASSAGYTPEYTPVPAYTTTKVVYGLSTVCPEPTTVTYGTKTYTVTKSTTIVDKDCEYTTTYAVKPTPSAYKPVYSAAKPSSAVPVYSVPAVVPYPSASKNATVPVYSTGYAKPTASVSKPAYPEFTGAAAQAGVGLMAVAGALAAFL